MVWKANSLTILLLALNSLYNGVDQSLAHCNGTPRPRHKLGFCQSDCASVLLDILNHVNINLPSVSGLSLGVWPMKLFIDGHNFQKFRKGNWFVGPIYQIPVPQ